MKPAGSRIGVHMLWRSDVSRRGNGNVSSAAGVQFLCGSDDELCWEGRGRRGVIIINTTQEELMAAKRKTAAKKSKPAAKTSKKTTAARNKKKK